MFTMFGKPSNVQHKISSWCQTTGGYPRIGTVIPRDLPRVAQAASGTAIRFEFITLEQAITLETQHRQDIKALGGQVTPLSATLPKSATCWPISWWGARSLPPTTPLKRSIKCRPSI